MNKLLTLCFLQFRSNFLEVLEIRFLIKIKKSRFVAGSQMAMQLILYLHRQLIFY